jgi:hypothetical protein
VIENEVVFDYVTQNDKPHPDKTSPSAQTEKRTTTCRPTRDWLKKGKRHVRVRSIQIVKLQNVGQRVLISADMKS